MPALPITSPPSSIPFPLSKTSPEAPKGSLAGRKVTPIPYYILIASALIGVIVGIAAWILNQRQVTALSIVLVATNLLGAFQIKRLEVQKELEDDINKLGTDTKQIEGLNSQLDKENNQLKDSLKQYEQTISKAEDTYRTQTGTISQLSADLASTQTKLTKLSQVVAPMQAAIGTFANSATQLTTLSETEKQSLQALSTQLNASTSLVSLLDKEDSEMQAHISALQQITTHAAHLPQQINGALTSLNKENDELKKINDSLKQNIITETGEIDNLKSILEKIQTERAGLAQDYEKFQSSMPSQSELDALLEEERKQNEYLTQKAKK